METASTPTASEGTATPTSPNGSFPPVGFVRREEAARRLGVSIQTLKRWYGEGRFRCGQVVARPDRGWCKIFPVDEVERFRVELATGRGRVPGEMVDVFEVAKRFGASRSGWKKWVAAGRVPRGRRVRRLDVRGFVTAYTVAEVEAVAAMFDAIGRPYADPDRTGVVRVPVMSFAETRCEALIDAADLPSVEGRRWNWIERGDVYPAAVVLATLADHTPLKHVLLGLATDAWSIVHANGDSLDCRRDNLLVRTMSEKNGAKRKSRTYYGMPTSSRFKGVSFESKRGFWRATIKKGDDRRYLGRFRDELAAAEMYDAAARELFGEHARLNFPDGVDAWLEAETAPPLAAA